jgi:hypothetical protein
MPSPAAFVMSVCIVTQNYDENCSEMTLQQAARELGVSMATNILFGTIRERAFNYAKVDFPASVPYAQIPRAIVVLAINTIEAAKTKMKADVGTLTPFVWDTPQERYEKRSAIDRWAESAKEIANTGKTWEREPKRNNAYFSRWEALNQAREIDRIKAWRNQ